MILFAAERADSLVFLLESRGPKPCARWRWFRSR
jgi:hypothetical protein